MRYADKKIPLYFRANLLRWASLTATIGGQDYACDFTPGLAAGTSYTYTITIKKNSLEVSNATITNWAIGTSGSGTATPK